MYILIATLQTFVSELLIKLGERGKCYWTYTGILVLLFLTYLALIRMLRDQHLSNKSLSDNNQDFIFSRLFFSIIIAFTIIILRLPGLSFLELNVDESGWIAGANTFSQDPRPWLAVDGGTGGPLTMFPLLIIKLFGGSINYGTVKLFAISIWVANSLLLYYTFINLFGDRIARILILPLVASVATFTYHDYLAYNGEHFPLFLISLSFFLYSKITCTNHSKENFYAFLLGFVLGCVPYSKLQATPIALCIAFCSVVFISKKRLPYLIVGGIAFPMIISAYLLIVNNFNNFLNSYILNNISYATRVDKSLSEKFFTYFSTTIVPDTHLLLIIQSLVIFLSGIILFRVRKTITKSEYRLIFLGIASTIASVYAVIQPGNPFTHYTLLLLVPYTFLSSSILGIALSRYLSNSSHTKYYYILLPCLFILAGTILPVTKTNHAFKHAPVNNFIGKHKSEISRKILEHAKNKDRMAVWGWANHFYAETGLAQGTRDGTSQFQIENGPLQDYYINRYVTDLKANKPSFFVDAVSPSQFAYQNRATQGYENFPHIKAIVDSYYTLLSEIEGVRIFMLRPQGAKVDLPSDLSVYTGALPKEKQNLRISIDSYKEDEQYITVNGWAFIIDQPAANSKISLMLLSEEQHYILKTYTRFRPDVSAAFGGELDNCGFLGIIPKQQLAKGRYKLALLVTDASTGREGFAVVEGKSLEIP